MEMKTWMNDLDRIACKYHSQDDPAAGLSWREDPSQENDWYETLQKHCYQHKVWQY